MSEPVLRAQALCREVLESVLAGVAERAEGLRATLREATGEARERYEKTSEAMRADAARQEEREARRRLSQAEHQAHRRLLDVRERLLAALLQAGLTEALARWRADTAPLAEALALDGLRQFQGEAEIDVRVSADAAPSLPEDFCHRLEQRCHDELGWRPALRLRPSARDCPPGVQVVARGGAVLYDNTIADRLRRAGDRLRSLLAAMLEGDPVEQEETGDGR